MIKFIVPLVFLLVTAFPMISSAQVIDGIAAIVNDDIITYYEVNNETANLIKNAQKKGPVSAEDEKQIRSAALDRLIDKKLIENKIKELGISVSEEEVRQSIDEVKKQNNLSQDSLMAALATQGLTYEQYKSQVRDQLERLRLMSQEVRSKIQVGEREMKEYYNANLPKFGAEETFHARQIFFALPKNATAKEVDKIRTKAESVLKEARSGKDFVELAKKYSDDPRAATDGGDLGTFKKGDMLPEVEQAILKMQPGNISDVITTTSGFHIIELEKREMASAKPFEEVKAGIEDFLYKKKSEDRFNQWLEDLRKGASIEIKQETVTRDQGSKTGKS